MSCFFKLVLNLLYFLFFFFLNFNFFKYSLCKITSIFLPMLFLPTCKMASNCSLSPLRMFCSCSETQWVRGGGDHFVVFSFGGCPKSNGDSVMLFRSYWNSMVMINMDSGDEQQHRYQHLDPIWLMKHLLQNARHLFWYILQDVGVSGLASIYCPALSSLMKVVVTAVTHPNTANPITTDESQNSSSNSNSQMPWTWNNNSFLFPQMLPQLLSISSFLWFPIQQAAGYVVSQESHLPTAVTTSII